MGYLLSLFLSVVLATTSFAQYVRIEQHGEQYSFTQEKNKFYSIGVNCVLIKDDPAMDPKDTYYNQASRAPSDWVKEVRERFKEWGFNTVGPFSSTILHKELLYTHSIYFGNYSAKSTHMLADVWSKEYLEILDEYARNECTPRKNDSNLIGYFISNEIKIYGDLPWRPHKNSLLDVYLKLPEDSPGHRKVVEFIRKTSHLTTLQQMDAWVGVVMSEYMRVCVEAIRRYDSNHLILGTRFASVPPDEVVQAVAKHSDVISFNLYNHDFSLLDYWHKLTKKPVMITEFSWRAVINKTGNRNVHGPDVTVATDADRAVNYKYYLDRVMARPFIIGLQWFQYFDEPASGRGSDGYGEDGAYGLVSVNNEIYDELVQSMAKANKQWQDSLSR